MDQLETQVSDLRSFLETTTGPQGPEAAQQVVSPHHVGPHRSSSHHSPFSAPGDNSAPQHHHPQSPLDAHAAGSSATANANANAKRRAEEDDDGPARQQRSKRNRYISIACNECKRRKIKCNGQTPCQRCGHLNLQCLYAPNCCSNFKDSDEFRQMADQIRQLQDHVDTLFNSMNSLRQETARLAPLQERVLPLPAAAAAVATPSPSASSGTYQRPALPFRVPSYFNGPTSLAFTVGVAKNTLHKMGYSGVADGNGDSNEDSGTQPDSTPHASPSLPPVFPDVPAQGSVDPIWEFDETEMRRLLQVFCEEIDVMYPVTSIDAVKEHIKHVASWTDTARRPGAAPSPGLEQIILDPKTLLLKILLCCALVVAEHGNSDRAVRLYDSVQPTVDKMLTSEAADVSRLSFLALCAGYRYLSNDEVLAWRLIGHVARLCFELGLHRREGLQKIADPQLRRNALHTFWSAYVLDRRWSFSTGLPFVCHDDKIDPNLPYPEGHPFLISMIGYSRLAAKIWRLVDYFEPAVIRELKSHDFDALDREIMGWYQTVPEEMQTRPLENGEPSVPSGPYNAQRVRVWIWLRLNQVRIWLYTPVLHSATSISENVPLARKAVDLAQQTIRLLAQLNNETDLYRRIQVFYHQFLTSSIAVLFLASTHAPLLFSAMCRDEFYMALDLVKELSSRSWVSHRLWRTIRSLRAYAPKLGLGDSSARFPAAASPYAHAGGSSSGSSGYSPSVPGLFHSGDPSRPGSRGRSTASVASPPAPTPGPTQPMQLDDPLSNGQRLQSEMLRIYEGYTGRTGAGGGSVAGPGTADMGYGSPGLGITGSLAGGEGVAAQKDASVYQHLKDMF